MPATSLWDLVRVYQYFSEPKPNSQDALNAKLAERQAMFEQDVANNARLRESLPQGISDEQRFGLLAENPNMTQYVMPQLVRQTLANEGKMSLEQFKQKQNRFKNFQFGSEGRGQVFDTENFQTLTVPGGPGFIPQPKKVSSQTVNVNTYQSAIDKQMAKLAPDYFNEYRQKADLADSMYKNVLRADKLLEGETTGSFANIYLSAQKAAQAVGVDMPNLNASIGRREAAEMIAISNALVALQGFKGPTTDFEFRKAYEANPNLLTTAAGRKQALVALKRDAERTGRQFNEANEARKNRTFDETFTPSPEPNIQPDEGETVVIDGNTYILKDGVLHYMGEE